MGEVANERLQHAIKTMKTSVTSSIHITSHTHTQSCDTKQTINTENITWMDHCTSCVRPMSSAESFSAVEESMGSSLSLSQSDEAVPSASLLVTPRT